MLKLVYSVCDPLVWPVSSPERNVPQQPQQFSSRHRLPGSGLPTHRDGFGHERWNCKYGRNAGSALHPLSHSATGFVVVVRHLFVPLSRRCPQPQLTTLDVGCGDAVIDFKRRRWVFPAAYRQDIAFHTIWVWWKLNMFNKCVCDSAHM